MEGDEGLGCEAVAEPGPAQQSLEQRHVGAGPDGLLQIDAAAGELRRQILGEGQPRQLLEQPEHRAGGAVALRRQPLQPLAAAGRRVAGALPQPTEHAGRGPGGRDHLRQPAGLGGLPPELQQLRLLAGGGDPDAVSRRAVPLEPDVGGRGPEQLDLAAHRRR